MGSVEVSRRGVSEDVLARLSEAGFVRRRVGIAEYAIGQPEVVGWLGLSTGRAAVGRFWVYPNVGVGHKAIAPLLRELMPELPPQPRAATVSLNIADAEGGKSRGWLFGAGIDNEAAVSGLVENVRRVAPPFMRRLGSDPAALQDLVDRTHMQRTTILPLLMLTHGEAADARRFVEDAQRELPSEGLYRDFYRVFAERVIAICVAREKPFGR
jgi:hypothetical protein